MTSREGWFDPHFRRKKGLHVTDEEIAVFDERRGRGEAALADPQPRPAKVSTEEAELVGESGGSESTVDVSHAEGDPQLRPGRRRDAEGDFQRERALKALETESGKDRDRISASHGERVRRMRSSEERRKEKAREVPKKEERLRRIMLLLRAGAYDRSRFGKLEDNVDIHLTRGPQVDKEPSETDTVTVSKSDLETWLASLTPAERQRLYVIGRKKIDFKIRREKEHRYEDGDDGAAKAAKDKAFERYKRFQEEQKRLADALEVVSVPMLRSTLSRIGIESDVYIASSNDDIAGGLDIVIELKKDGQPLTFSDGNPMKFVVDVTYARMWNKVDLELDRGRISNRAYAILKGKNRHIPSALSGARAMKLFRSVVETLGGPMSIQTFGKDGPLETPQEHVPRLIIGLDWKNAFAAIANWVEDDDFEQKFGRHGEGMRRLSQDIEWGIRNQMIGLHALTRRAGGNENTPYLEELMKAMDITEKASRPGPGDDESLENINNLLTLDDASAASELKNRLYKAALAQIKEDAKRGGRIRGDMGGLVKSEIEALEPPVPQGKRERSRRRRVREELSEESEIPDLRIVLARITGNYDDLTLEELEREIERSKARIAALAKKEGEHD